MIYRPLGRSDAKISQLGFGCMRFPLTVSDDPTTIDEMRATEMLHFAIDNGVNVVDNAWPYHRETSEPFLGRALRGGYRDNIYLATKLPVWLVKNRDDSEKYFNRQLKRLQTDRIELYLLHSLSKKPWQTVQEHGVLQFLDRMKTARKIQYAGFSYHDDLALFKEIVDAYSWDFCLIHLNYVDDDYQAGVGGLQYAHQKGLAVFVMEPLRGGKLAGNVPDEVLQIVERTDRVQTPAEFALRWLFNQPEVTCVLSGMTTLEQVKANIRFASQDHIGTLSDTELLLYTEAKTLYRSRIKVNCTQCGYCMPCSQKIPISFIMELYNDAYMYGAFEDSRRAYSVFISPEGQAHNCTECGECEEKCPQKLPISELLKKAHAVLGKQVE